jgi:hypothetical protein
MKTFSHKSNLPGRSAAMERWLRAQVGPAYDALKAHPWLAVTIDQVKAQLAAEHQRARFKRP